MTMYELIDHLSEIQKVQTKK